MSLVHSLMPYQLTIKNKAALPHSPYFQLNSPSVLATPPSPSLIKAKSKDNEIGLLKHQIRVAREESNQYRAICRQLQDELAGREWQREEQSQSCNALVFQWEVKLQQAQQALTSLQNQLQSKDCRHVQELLQMQKRSKQKSERLAALAQELLLARSRALLLESKRQQLCNQIKQLKGLPQLH